ARLTGLARAGCLFFSADSVGVIARHTASQKVPLGWLASGTNNGKRTGQEEYLTWPQETYLSAGRTSCWSGGSTNISRPTKTATFAIGRVPRACRYGPVRKFPRSTWALLKRFAISIATNDGMGEAC